MYVQHPGGTLTLLSWLDFSVSNKDSCNQLCLVNLSVFRFYCKVNKEAKVHK